MANGSPCPNRTQSLLAILLSWWLNSGLEGTMHFGLESEL